VKGNVYAVNAESGAEIWKDRIDPHPVARVTGAPALVDGRLYVPMSSLEESGAGNPSYPCCTFRGGVGVVRRDERQALLDGVYRVGSDLSR
jgi:polyvinyl alcohol dehydrogenase (cytochrome)